MRGSQTQESPDADDRAVGVVLAGERIDDAEIATELPALLRTHRAVLFREMPDDPDRQLALTASLGTILGVHRDRGGRLVPEMRLESSRRADIHAERWHADTSWASEPSRFTLLYAVQIDGAVAPTELLDTSLVVDRMEPSRRRELAAITVRHHVAAARREATPSDLGSRTRRRFEAAWRRSHDRRLARNGCRVEEVKHLHRPTEPGAGHRLLDVDPWTGRSFLRCGEHAWRLDHLDPVAGRSMLDELEASFGNPHFVHRWRTGDLLVFDNHLLLHRRGPQPRDAGRRTLRRTLAWCPPTPVQELDQR